MSTTGPLGRWGLIWVAAGIGLSLVALPSAQADEPSSPALAEVLPQDYLTKEVIPPPDMRDDVEQATEAISDLPTSDVAGAWVDPESDRLSIGVVEGSDTPCARRQCRSGNPCPASNFWE